MAREIYLLARKLLHAEQRLALMSHLRALVEDLARCEHLHTYEPRDSGLRWCKDCGALQAAGVAAWAEPKSWVRAKELDTVALSAGATSAVAAPDSGPKIVN